MTNTKATAEPPVFALGVSVRERAEALRDVLAELAGQARAVELERVEDPDATAVRVAARKTADAAEAAALGVGPLVAAAADLAEAGLSENAKGR